MRGREATEEGETPVRADRAPGMFTCPCLSGILRDLGQKPLILRLSVSVLGRDTQAIAALT